MRLITRSDFDGLMCGVLLSQVEQIDSVLFVHPKDVQDGTVKAGPNDILTNLPYQPGCGLWFDHHASEAIRNDMDGIGFRGRFDVAPSAARVVYDHYVEQGKGAKLRKFKKILEAVDKADSADLSKDDVTRPRGWILLSYILDPRTGLGYQHDYAISNRELMSQMLDLIGAHPVAAILKMPDVAARVAQYRKDQAAFAKLLLETSRLDKNVVVTDLRGRKDLPAGNRFLIYTLFPKANISVRIFDGKGGERTIVAVGHSIFRRTSKTDVGKLMGKYGGGGHRGAGTCQLPPETANAQIKKILTAIKRAG